MGLVDRVNAALAESRNIEARAIGGLPWRPWDDVAWRFDVGGPVHPSRGGPAGIDGALRLQPVYSSIRIIAEGVAQLPLQQFRDLGDKRAKMPLGQLLSKPSAFLNTFDWLFQYISSAGLTGTAWGLKTARDGYGYPTGIEWLPPEAMVAEDSSPFNPAKTKFFFYGRPVSRDDLLIVRAFTVPGRTAGISPLRAFQMLIESGLDALAYGRDWFSSGGFPPGTFQNTQYEVEDEQSNKIKAKLVAAQRRREPLVFGRDWTYTPISVPPNEAQFVEAMQLNASQIAAIYGVPPHRVGGSTAGGSITYSNSEAEAIGLISDTLDPWLVRLETALSSECLPSAQYAQFNRNARLRSSTADRYGVYRTARDIGILNVNEIRALEDMEPLPKSRGDEDYDGDDYTPLQIQIAAARGLKEAIGGPQAETPVPAVPARPGPGQAQHPPLPPGQQPAPVPAANGKGSANGQHPRPLRPARAGPHR